MANVFVQGDWSQMESWLTAHAAQDPVMLGELRNQLAGGPKIHARNAVLIYGDSHGVTVDNCKDVKVQLTGQQRPAYDAGKRCAHLWNYGGGPEMLAQTFWLRMSSAREIHAKLNDKYSYIVKWREEIADTVYGIASYVCHKCGYSRVRDAGSCPECRDSIDGTKTIINLRFRDWEKTPQRMLYTPFKRRRIYMGRRSDGANAVASQIPQSCGASVMYRTWRRLRGGTGWPVPHKIVIRNTTYDSFLLECAADVAEDAAAWLAWTMEQAWPQLTGLRLPAELAIGDNWDEQSENNPQGLKEIVHTAFAEWAA